jgi:hypothetical protein
MVAVAVALAAGTSAKIDIGLTLGAKTQSAIDIEWEDDTRAPSPEDDTRALVAVVTGDLDFHSKVHEWIVDEFANQGAKVFVMSKQDTTNRSDVTPGSLKSSSPMPNVTVFDVDNRYGAKGARECGGYLQYILQMYDTLPAYTLFTHGEKDVKWTGANKELLDGAQEGFHNYGSVPLFRCLKGDYWCIRPDVNELIDTLNGIEPGSMPNRVDCVMTSCCANFILSRERIRMHTREFYSAILAYAEEERPESSYKREGRYATSRPEGVSWKGDYFLTHCHDLEHLWHIIFGEPPMMKLPPARPALVAGAWVSPPLSMAYFKSFVVERGQDAVREYGVEKLAQMYNVNGSVVKHAPLHV